MRCFRCGSLIPNGQQRLREAEISRSSSTFYMPMSGSFGFGSSSTKAYMWHCKTCTRIIDERTGMGNAAFGGCFIPFLLACYFFILGATGDWCFVLLFSGLVFSPLSLLLSYLYYQRKRRSFPDPKA